MPRLIALDQLQQFTAVQLLSDPGAIGGPKLCPSVAEIVMVWTLSGGKIAHNVMHGRYTGTFAGTVAQANSIVTALTTGGPYTAFATHLASTTALGQVYIRDIAVPNQPAINSTLFGPPGTGAGVAMPNEVALCITAHTALAGRANRGRIYIPGWHTAATAADNTVVAQAVTDLQGWANTIQGAVTASGYQLVIAQPARQAYIGSTGTSHPARPAGSTTVSSLFVRDNHWDSQRRRGLK
jgi:hypothetical protein